MRKSANPPVYSQIAYDIAAKIASGEMNPGDRFSGRSLMGTNYNVSSETIRRAMWQLSGMGIVTMQVGVGYVVQSRHRAAEYVEQHKARRDLRALKSKLKELLAQRETLNQSIEDTITQILDLSERFRDSELLRTYDFTLEPDSPAVGRSIGELNFRHKTGATIVVIRSGEEVQLSPGPNTVLQAGDVLTIACDLAAINGVSLLLQPEQPAGMSKPLATDSDTATTQN